MVLAISLKNSDKSKFVCNGYGLAFDDASTCSFKKDFARNVVIFGVCNSSLSPDDNRRNKCLVLIEELTNINGSVCTVKKSLVLILVKQKQNFA